MKSLGLHQDRNCRRFFPDDVKPEERVKDAWVPFYETGQERYMVPIPDARSVECPVSLLHRHPSASDMVYQIHTASMVKELTGAMLYGNDTAKWPEKFHEAVVLAERERRRVEAAQDEYTRQRS